MPNAHTLKILFGGDFAPKGAYEPLIHDKGGAIFGDARARIAEADFSIVNLESPLCRGIDPAVKAGPTMCAAPDSLNALSEAGIDAVCLANNHIFDFGEAGLSQTLSALDRQKIQHAGAGPDRETAEAALRVVIGGRRISIFSFAEREFNLSDDGQAGAAILDPLRVAPLLLAERPLADALIICVHGGNEYFPYPRPGLRQICQFLIDLGADAVIGHHPHVPGPYEIYQGKPIVYSLGNLIFATKNPRPGWDEGYFASLHLGFAPHRLEEVTLELIPYRQSAAQGGMRMMESSDRDRFLSKIEEMRDHLENRPEEWKAAWQHFVASRQTQRLIDLSSPIRFRGFRHLMKIKLLRNIISPPSQRMHRLNLLRCDSHRELLISAMEGK